MWHCLRDPVFSHFDTILACDRQMDGQTHDDGYYHASLASRGKNSQKLMSGTCTRKHITRTWLTSFTNYTQWLWQCKFKQTATKSNSWYCHYQKCNKVLLEIWLRPKSGISKNPVLNKFWLDFGHQLNCQNVAEVRIRPYNNILYFTNFKHPYCHYLHALFTSHNSNSCLMRSSEHNMPSRIFLRDAL